MAHRALHAAAIAVGFVSTAIANQPSNQQLEAQIKSISQRISQLEQTQSEMVRPADVDATVADVLRDADRRSQLMQAGGVGSGYHDGMFLIASDDGGFTLHPSIFLQIRNVTDYRQSGKSDNRSDLENGFEIRRLKARIDGNLFAANVAYAFQLTVDRRTGVASLEDAWVRYQFSRDWAFRTGQFKDPFARESLIGARRLMTVERSYANEFFSPAGNYVEGLTLIYDAPQSPLRGEGGITHGSADNTNDNFQDYPVNNANYGAAGRVEYKIAGDWNAYDDFTALGTKRDLLVLGGGLDYTEAGDTGRFQQTVDAQYENPAGLGLYAALYGRYTKHPQSSITSSPAPDNTWDWGIVGQASYLATQRIEPFARYDLLHLDDDGSPSSPSFDVNEFTVGANYYLHNYFAKLTLDLGWLPDGAPIADTGAGIAASRHDQMYLRAQFQLVL